MLVVQFVPIMESENGRYLKVKVGDVSFPSGTEVLTDRGLGVVIVDHSVVDQKGKLRTVALQIHELEDGVEGKFISAENRWIVEMDETIRLTGKKREVPEFFWWRLQRKP